MLDKTRFIRSKLLSWYRKHARDLPWRHTCDPYKIWVSEIMLQQTQVQTVIPYYTRWLERFPTLEALAKAPQEEVMKYWAGLGYYRRVKMLHAAADFVQTELQGVIPSSPDELRKIPGIGRYTAGAIASIAFQKPAPLVDGNVIRILTRLYGLKKNTAHAGTLKHLWWLAEKLVPEKNPGDFNQAMMELGATVCLPKSPSCRTCPVQKECRALAAGNPESFPVKTQKEKIQKIKSAALILKNPQGQVLIDRQPQNARWGGLWMFPHGENKEKVADRFKLTDNPSAHSFIIKHSFTKYSIQLHVFEAGVSVKTSKKLAAQGHRWTSVPALENFAFPSPHQKIARHLLEKSHDLTAA
ncbi:MAG: A/G-specific adenine glycosylase [Candidatus Omnitrophica bacterium]|nr:A/G-specific adenine glycosylase [Candidatus Omnitrophota bacterium]